MKTWVITCTGGRPEALVLCNHYMARQSHQDFEWIVVDDGPELRQRPRRADVFVRRSPAWEPGGPNTLIENMRAGLGVILNQAKKPEGVEGLVLLVEDDDWYHPGYIGLMQNYAENLPDRVSLFGESHTRYYNVRWRTYRHNDNDGHASLCATCFTTDFIPYMLEILDRADPARPFIDVTAFNKHRDKAMLFPTDLVCGIKGMPGRPGIGHGHSASCKRLLRDPYLEKLLEWIGTDLERYRVYYHDEEMRDVPVLPEQRQEPWAMRELSKKEEGQAGVCGIFRQPGVLPDLGAFAAGAFAHGYLNEFRDIADARLSHFPPVDMAVISGGFIRHGGLNGVVHHHYRSIGVPVIICDPGRIVKGAQRIQINKEQWLPPRPCPRDRLALMGFDYVPKPRGKKVLIAGQRPDLDNHLAPALEAMRGFTDRQFVFRPHPNMYRGAQRKEYDLPYDRVSIGDDRISSKSLQSLENDLDDAWCVVTHSSLVGVTALMRGIPVMAAPEAVFYDVAYPLDFNTAAFVEEFKRPDWDVLHDFLRRLSYSFWFEGELRNGKAFAYLKQFIKKEDHAADHLV